jgi:hypothetical protein
MIGLNQICKSKVPREMSVNRIMISNIDPKYTAEYIANVFWRKDIGKVSSITLLPQIDGGEVSNIAYITFGSFCDSKSAKHFITDMTGVEGYMCGHNDPEEDNIWVLEPNTHHHGELCVGEFTTKFTDDFFARHSLDTTAAQVGEDEVEDEWRQYMEEISLMPPPQREVTGCWLPPLPYDLSRCSMLSMERQVAMTNQEITDLLEEQRKFKEQFQVKPLS